MKVIESGISLMLLFVLLAMAPAVLAQGVASPSAGPKP